MPELKSDTPLGTADAPGANLGHVVAVRGSVVDVCFEQDLPAINSLLRVAVTPPIVVEVLSQRDNRHVRCIALTPTQGLARGMVVTDSGGPLLAPVGPLVLSRMFDVMGNVIDRKPALGTVEWRSVHKRTAAAAAALDQS